MNKNVRLFKKIAIIFFSSMTFLCAISSEAANEKDLWVYVTNDKSDDLIELLNRGLDPNTVNKNNQPALIQAVRDGSWKVFDALLASPKINVNQLNQLGESPLMYVALVGDLPRAQKLIALGANVNKSDWTPLHYASIKGRANIAKLLLSKGADPNEVAPTGDTALILAVQSDNIETVQLLLNAGADPSASNFKAQDAVEIARMKGKNDLAAALEKIAEKRRASDNQK
ncbi:MAG TPA: hypothetical protein DDY24_08135 [Alcaligenaceae bacterium]|nr:hypothetical protein [Alcaligenaceae bacterium]